ncbi:MAG: hypothetical protein RLZZ612_1480 [Pseudomonadota bacterium]|jgi:translocation and assembly module TamB
MTDAAPSTSVPHPAPPPPATPTEPTPAKKPRRFWHHALSVLLKTLWTSHRLIWALALGGLAALWGWSGTSTSLAQALTLGRWVVPSLHALQWQDMKASVRHGGTINGLQWRDPKGTQLDIAHTDVAWGWQGGPWLTLALQQMRLKTAPTPADSTPSAPLQPPTDLRLPLAVPVRVELHLSDAQINQVPIAQLHARYDYRPSPDVATAATATAGTATAVAAPTHHLEIKDVEVAQGRYHLQAQVEATAPMPLQMQFQGELKGALPEQTTVWHAQAQGKAEGTLATADARIALTLDVQSDAPAHTAGPQAHLSADLRPWQTQPVAVLDATWKALDAHAFLPTLPHTQLSGKAQVTSQDGEQLLMQLELELDNPAAGPWDAQRLPLQHLQLVGGLRDHKGRHVQILHIQQLQAQVADGRIDAQGTWLRPMRPPTAPADAPLAPSLWNGHLTVQQLRSSGLWQAWPASVFDVKLSAQSLNTDTEAVRLTLELDSQADGRVTPSKKQRNSDLEILRQARISAQADWSAPTLTLTQLQAQLAGATLHAEGHIDTQHLGWTGKAKLNAPGLALEGDGALSADQGEGKASLQVDEARTFSTWAARLPGLPPDISRQIPAFSKGSIQTTAKWQGGWKDLRWQTDTRITELQAPASQERPAWQIANAQLHAQHDGERASGQLALDAVWDQWRAQGDWSAEAQRPAAADWRIALAPWTLHLHPAPSRKDKDNTPGPLRVHAPEGQVLTLPKAEANAPLWQVAASQLQLSGPELSPLVLRWQPLQGSQSGGFEGRGDFSGLHLAQVRQWLRLAPQGQDQKSPSLPPALDGDLHLGGEWRLQLPAAGGGQPQITFKIQRESGDVVLKHNDTPQALGLQTLLLHVHTPAPNDWQAQVQAVSTHGGTVDAQLSTSTATASPSTSAQWPHADSPLQGRVKVSVPELSTWAILAPPGWRLAGRLSADVQLQGRLGQVDGQGQLRAQDMALRSVVDGLAYQNGQFLAQFNGQRLDIQEGRIEGEGGAAQGGTLHFKGHAAWPTAAAASPPADTKANTQAAKIAKATPDAGPTVVLEAKADKLKVSARADRRLTLSGQVNTTWAANALQVRGQLQADQALFILPEETAPTQGSDVVVRPSRQAAAAPAPDPSAPSASTTADVVVHIDLGPQFEVKGQGLNTRLGGQLAVSSVAGGRGFQVRGEVQTLGGSYRAYGQNLRIAQGAVRFSGPYDNPALNILALRGSASPSRSQNDTGDALSGGDSQQQVGVKITGNARAPRLQLYALPDLPDSEKLAWLVLGRPASGTGAEAAAMQQAALALLGSRAQDSQGGLASALGLDELSLGSTQNGNSGSSTAALTVGKRISDRVYVAYEQSLGGAMGALSLFYDLSRRLTLRAQTGQHNALDVVYTRTHE